MLILLANNVTFYGVIVKMLHPYFSCIVQKYDLNRRSYLPFVWKPIHIQNHLNDVDNANTILLL